MIVILKTLEEIEKIKRSSQIVAETLILLKKEAVPGVSTKKLDKIAEEFIRDHNAVPAFKGYKNYPFTICSSLNEEIVHGMPSSRKLKEGDVLSIDCGAVFEGYYGDSAITVSIGEVSEDIKKIIEVGQECLYKGVLEAKVGNRLRDISLAIQQHAEKNGYNVIRNFVGHGVGRELHEFPQVYNYADVSLDRGLLLKPGMVLAIEPMITSGNGNIKIMENKWTAKTKDKTIAVHWEHTIAITQYGPEILTLRKDELWKKN